MSVERWWVKFAGGQSLTFSIHSESHLTLNQAAAQAWAEKYNAPPAYAPTAVEIEPVNEAARRVMRGED